MTTMTRPLRLYELSHAFEAIDAAIEDMGGELTAEVEAQLDALEATLEDKAEGVCALIRQAKSEQEFFAAELSRMEARFMVAKKRAERLTDYLHRNLVALGRDRVETPRFKVRVQRNSAPSIRWCGEPDAIPEPFRRVKVELDGTAARDGHAA